MVDESIYHHCILCDAAQGSGKIKTNHDKPRTSDRVLYECQNCGNYEVSESAEATIRSAQDRWVLSGFVREKTLQGQPPVFLNSHNFQEIINQYKSMNVMEKLERLLKVLGSMSSHPGSEIYVFADRDYPFAFCQNMEEFTFYLSKLEAEELITGNGRTIVLTPKAWARLQNPATNLNSNKVFVARWIPGDDSIEVDRKNMGDYLKSVSGAVGAADYDLDLDLEAGKNEKICDRIIAKIRLARFVIVDATSPENKGQRGSVYYEAGFAYGLNLSIIWTCRKGQLDILPFDTRQYPHIDWDPANMDKFQHELEVRILAEFGKGLKK